MRKVGGYLLLVCVIAGTSAGATAGDKRPNIVFAFGDDFGRFASVYRDDERYQAFNSLIETPNIDRIAREGVRHRHAYVPCPSCTPCRSSILTGRYFWNTRLGAILSGAVLDESMPTFTKALENDGYRFGYTRKVWNPGNRLGDAFGQLDSRFDKAGWTFSKFSNTALSRVDQGGAVEDIKAEILTEVGGNFEMFLETREGNQPFFYWWGPTVTHRQWAQGSGKRLWGLEPDDLAGKMPPYWPDVPEVREDVVDYLGECLAFDRGVGELIRVLEERGELDDTLFVVSGDHGIPGFPRAKCNLYDIGVEVALAARLPGRIGAGRVVDDMTTLKDLAMTFLDAAGVEGRDGLEGNSLWDIWTSDRSGLVEPDRTFVVTGRERHVDTARDGNLPYPQRAIRTADFLYIRNFEPDRWPMGSPPRYRDHDGGPTKKWIEDNLDDSDVIYRLAFSKRPAEELYDLDADPHQMRNVAEDGDYAPVKDRLREQLMTILREENDPRVLDGECRFEFPPYTDAVDKTRSRSEWEAWARQRLDES